MHAAETPNLKIDQQQAKRQLEYISYKPGENVYLRFFYHSEDPRKQKDKGRKLNRLRWNEAEAYQRDGRGVYVVVNGAGGGHEDKDVKQCAAIFCEWDDRPVSEQFLHWETVGFLEPTFTVYSGDKSAQPYWVFDQPITVEQWCELQLLLIEVMGADPSNKNPSRVFRLAGGWHIKPGREPQRTEIVQDSGVKYSYQVLRDRLLELQPQPTPTQEVQQPLLNDAAANDIVDLISEYIPLRHSGSDMVGDCPFCNARDKFLVKQKYQTFECLSCQAGGDADNYHGSAADFLNKYRAKSGTTKTIRYNDIQVPVPESVPLELCLSKESRELLRSGGPHRGRNTGGAKLARDLIGTVNYLQDIRQQFNGDPWQLFLDYCNRCPDGYGWNQVEWESIWKSAEGDRPTPSCKEEGVQNCIKAWYWNTCIKPSQQNYGVKSNNSKNNSSGGSGNIVQLSEFTSTPPSSFEETMEQVRQIQEIEDEARQTWELGLLAKSVRVFSTAQLLNIYTIKEQNSKPFNPIDLHDFLARGTDEREWLVAAHISVSTTLVLFADGGVGKTLLGYDIGKAIATGKPWNGFRVRQGKVLIVQTDEPEIDTRERLNIANFATEVARGAVQIETNWQFSQIRRLREWIARERPVFVMIDSLTSANRISGDQEKDATYASSLYELRDIANEYNCSIMVLHHENKGGGARGTTAIRNNVSEVWRLRKGEQKEILTPTQRVLEVEKSRSGCSGTFKIELNVEDYSWQHLGDFGADENSAGLPLSARLLNYLEARPGLKFEPEELALEFSGSTKEAIRKQLERLRKKGLIDHEDRIKQRETGTVRYKVYYAPKLDASVDPETAKGESKDNQDSQNSEIKKDRDFSVQVTPKNAETHTKSNLDNLDNKPGQPGQVSRLETEGNVDENHNLDKSQAVQVMSRLRVPVVQVAPAMDLSDFRGNLDRKTESVLVSRTAVSIEEDPWLTSESLADIADTISHCEDGAMLAELRQMWPAHALTAACRLLDPEKREEVKRWVQEQNKPAQDLEVVQLPLFSLGESSKSNLELPAVEGVEWLDPEAPSYQEQCQAIAQAPIISLDVETYQADTPKKNQTPKATHPWKSRLRLVQLCIGEQTFLINLGGRERDFEETLRRQQPSIELLRSVVQNPEQRIVGHNIAFDLRFLATQLGIRNAKNVVCTMLGAQVYYGDYGAPEGEIDKSSTLR